MRAFVNFTEPIATLPVLTGVYAEEVQGPAVAEIALEGAQQNLAQQAFRHTVLVSDHEGRYELLLNDVEDAAGNVLTGTVLGAFTIDGSPPTIDAVTLNAERFSAQPSMRSKCL